METTKKLVMVFKTDGDNNVSMTIDNPAYDLSENQIKSAMERIIQSNVFAPKGEALVEAIEAKIVVTNKTEYDLA